MAAVRSYGPFKNVNIYICKMEIFTLIKKSNDPKYGNVNIGVKNVNTTFDNFNQNIGLLPLVLIVLQNGPHCEGC